MISIEKTSWSIPKKIGFRFAFVYLLLFVCFVNNGAFPYWYKIFAYPFEGLNMLLPWLSANVYGITEEVAFKYSGSGDTLFDYLTLLTIFLAAIISTITWSLLDSKRSNYTKLYYWLTVCLRYYVALMLVNYGLSKIIQLQFPFPGYYRMFSTIGETSPMGLAWTFLGFSKGYNIFMGIAELMAGFLLFRRTMTFGAVVTLMATMNVMAVNYFFDVPVKIVSTHLVLITLFLLSNDIKRLALFFFTDVKTKLSVIKRPKLPKGINIAMNSVKAIVIGYVFIFGFMDALDAEKQYGSKAPKPLLYGAYEVTNFVINGDTITNYKNDKLWRYIAIQREGSLQIRKFLGSPLYYGLEKDSLENKLKLTNWRDKEEVFDLNYKVIDTIGLDFNFIFKNDTITGTTRKLNQKDYVLPNRGFHWISENPYNR